ncbi:MAG TPA: DUF1365 domain-containing protein, partial [Acidimicrobiales bacterium]
RPPRVSGLGRDTAMVNSAVYEGHLSHRRAGPRDHRFTMGIAMVHLQLDELDEVFARHPLWSMEQANAVSFRRADYLGDPSVAIDVCVRDAVAAQLGWRPTGPVRMLTQLRTWGWLFNPVTFYFCMDPSGRHVEAMVLQVTNTPWREQHTYVVAGGEGEHRFRKELHVSPFFGMDHEYRLRVRSRGDRLVVELALLDGDAVVFDARLALRRRELDRASMGRLLWRYPLLTMRISVAIYTHAARLWSKGVPVHRHPGRAGQSPDGTSSSREKMAA